MMAGLAPAIHVFDISAKKDISTEKEYFDEEGPGWPHPAQP
jgi:hypothetical protein